jgi:hypothetical protein
MGEGLRAGHWRLVGSGVTAPGYSFGGLGGCAGCAARLRRAGTRGRRGEEEAALPHWGASGLAWGKRQRAAAVQGLGGSGVTDPGYRVGVWAGCAARLSRRGTLGWDRTNDQRIRNPLLYPLSYERIA